MQVFKPHLILCLVHSCICCLTASHAVWESRASPNAPCTRPHQSKNISHYIQYMSTEESHVQSNYITWVCQKSYGHLNLVYKLSNSPKLLHWIAMHYVITLGTGRLQLQQNCFFSSLPHQKTSFQFPFPSTS